LAKIRNRYQFKAPRQAVWDQFFDYDAAPPDFMKGASVEILTPGSPDPKGLGCVRQLNNPRGKPTVEEIVAWDPPRSFSYSVRSSAMPVKRYEGTMHFEERDGGTTAHYAADFDPKIPGTAWMVRAMFAVMGVLFIRRYMAWLDEQALRRAAK
jgi:hypothetical protein